MSKQGRPELKVGLKYCGSCNPQVDLSKIASHLARVAGSHGFHLIPVSDSNASIDILIILCGCPRACADKTRLTSKARCTLLISGQSINGATIAEADLPAAIEAEVLKIAYSSE